MRLVWILGLAAAAAAQNVNPKLISKQEPEYTEEARRAGVNANDVVAITVAADGLPSNVHVVRPAGFGLDARALEAVKSYRFDPATNRGTPVAVAAQVEVNFRLVDRAHRGQADRLYFTLLSPGSQAPELIRGKMPDNPNAQDARLRLALTVTADGVPQNVRVLEQTPD